MSLPAAPAAPAGMSIRFFVVGFLPAYAALLFLLILGWAVRGPGTSFRRAWATASGLTATEIVLIGLVTLLLALVLVPFQQGLVRLLEGAWPRWLGGDRSRARQLRRKDALAVETRLQAAEDVDGLRAGRAGYELRRRFPLPDHLVRATRLGNVLAAMEDRAGRDYGLDAVVAWPRLYPALNAPVKAIVDDRRNTLDYLGRLAVTGVVTGLAAIAVLHDARWWLLLALIPFGLAVLAYQGAVQAALAYSESVQAAFDTHHLALGAAFGLASPAGPEEERVAYRQLCDLWRQSVPPDFGYAPTKGNP